MLSLNLMTTRIKVIGALTIAVLVLVAFLFSRCGKQTVPTPTPTPSPTGSPTPLNIPRPSPEYSPQPRRSVKRVPKAPRAPKVARKTPPQATALVPCTAPPDADWLALQGSPQVRLRNGTITNLSPCLATVRFTEGDSIDFLAGAALNEVSAQVGASVQVQYYAVNNAVGYVKLADPPLAPSRIRTQTQAAISDPVWTFPDTTAKMPISPNIYRTVVSFTPPTNYVTGLENYNGYQPCQGANANPERLPCAYSFPAAKTRWYLMGACASGGRPGNPPQCWCVNGYAGNSGKCK